MDQLKIDALIDELPVMTRPRMAELWEEHFGKAPATKLRVDLMRPILAYRIQERQRGPLPSEMQRRLQEALKNIVLGPTTVPSVATRPALGSSASGAA